METVFDKGIKMKNIKNTEKYSSKIADDGNTVVAGIFFLYISLILLGVIYGVHCHDSNRCSQKTFTKHKAQPETTDENFGTVIAVAKEMDGHCEYRACDKTICDWYDNSNRECANMNKGDWTAIFGTKTYMGTSLCSETAGEFAKSGNPNQKPGAHCWCKSGAGWVHHLALGSATYCSGNGCAGNCAHGVLYSSRFRSALLKAQKQYTK